MRIGNLSRPDVPREGPDCVAFRAMRFLVVVGIMTAGSLALWLAEETPSGHEGVAAETQAAVSRPQRVSHPDRATLLQVADASPAGAGAASDYRPADGSAGAVVKSETAPAVVAKAVSPPAASTDRDAPAAGEQADWGQALPFGLPDDINVTGAVPQQANLSDDPAPASKTPLVDLNTAPLSQLNALKGAGGLGRAIIRGRPYASAEDLAKKRVVRRNVYERIKDQITVR